MQIRDWLRDAAAQLSESESPKRDAEILLGLVTGKSRAWLIGFDDNVLDAAALARLDALLARRATGEPIAYLTGEREFWSLSLCVTPDTLIPRPDSEVLVEQALAHLPGGPCSILDLGTGSGAIALALASERADCQVVGVDRIPAAVALAQHNAARLGLTNATFMPGNWFSALDRQRFAIIVSNPPYIDAADEHLSQGDVRFEPASALVAGDSGLADIKIIAAQAGQHLASGGWLLLEHGWQQGEQIRQILADNRFCQISTCQDYGGNDRVTFGQKNADKEV